jgi:outer membrane protein
MLRKIKFRLIYITICLAISSSVIGFAQEANEPVVLTLKSAISKALEKNWDVKMSAQDIKKAEEQINEAYSNAYPTVGFTGQYVRNFLLPVMFIPPNNPFNPTSSPATFDMGLNNGYTGTISLSQVIYSQKVNTAIKIASEYADFSKTGDKATKQQITLSVKKAFYGILLMKEMVKVSKQGYEVAKANYDNIASLYKQGVESEYDYLRADVQLANTQPVLIEAENSLELAKNALKNILAIDINKPIDVQGEFVFEDVSEAFIDESSKLAVSNSFLVKQLQIQESLLDKNITIEKSEYYPTVSLFGQYAWQSQDNTFKFSNYLWAKTFSAGIQVTYPIFDGFKRDARVQQAMIDKEKVSISRMKLEDGLKIQVTQSRMKMNEAKKRIDAQGKSIQQAEKALKIAQSRFKNGVGVQLELIDTQAALTTAQTNYAQAIYDYLTAKSDWEYAVTVQE